MGITTAEAREQILDDLAAAIDRIAIASSALAEAYEKLAVGAADRLEAGLYRPAQRALGRGKRAHSRFSEQVGAPSRTFEAPPPAHGRQTAKELVEQAVIAASEANARIAELQDSMLPIEFGDADLRAALGEIRELLAELPSAGREFLRTLGR